MSAATEYSKRRALREAYMLVIQDLAANDVLDADARYLMSKRYSTVSYDVVVAGRALLNNANRSDDIAALADAEPAWGI